MESRLKALQQRRTETEETLKKIRADLAKARKNWDAESAEALIAEPERAPDAKLAKKVQDLERQIEGLEATLTALGNAIALQAKREEADRDAARAKRILEFRKTEAPVLDRIRSSAQGLRDSVCEFFFDLQEQGVALDSIQLAEFLFPPSNSHYSGYDLAVRGVQVQLVNQALTWLQVDAGYSRSGRPERRPNA